MASEHETLDVPGVPVPVTQEQVHQALSILEADHSTNVKQPLRHRDNPLWQAEYLVIAAEWLSQHPEDKIPPGTPENHAAHVKTAFARYLEKLLEAPGAEAQAGTQPAVTAEQALATAKAEVGLLKAYSGRCAVTGCDAEPALEAAHLRPYKGPESNTAANGLLLRSDIHTLLFGCWPSTPEPGRSSCHAS